MKRSLCHPSKMHSQGSFAHFYHNSNASAASCIEKLTQRVFIHLKLTSRFQVYRELWSFLYTCPAGPLIFRAIFVYLFCLLISLDSLALVFRFNILGSFLHSSPCLNLILQNEPKLHAITLVCTHNCGIS